MNKLIFTIAIIICAVAAATAQNRTMYQTYLANADSFYLAGDYTKALFLLVISGNLKLNH